MNFKEQFNETPEASGFAEIPEGEYTAEITDFQIDMTKTPVRCTVTYTLTADGVKGRKVFGNYKLEGSGIGYIKKDMKTLGIDYSNVEKAEDIADLFWKAMDEGCGVLVYVKPRVWEGKKLSSVYLNERLSSDKTKADGFDEVEGIPF